MDKLFQLSDIGISSSKQEGLPINTLEEMFTGLPVIVSDERGYRELVVNEVNGCLFEQRDYKSFVSKISKLKSNTELRLEMGKQARLTANRFELRVCLTFMSKIFRKHLNE
ncbi:glycosyltransferase [Sphingobacterium faecium]